MSIPVRFRALLTAGALYCPALAGQSNAVTSDGVFWQGASRHDPSTPCSGRWSEPPEGRAAAIAALSDSIALPRARAEQYGRLVCIMGMPQVARGDTAWMAAMAPLADVIMRGVRAHPADSVLLEMLAHQVVAAAAVGSAAPLFSLPSQEMPTASGRLPVEVRGRRVNWVASRGSSAYQYSGPSTALHSTAILMGLLVRGMEEGGGTRAAARACVDGAILIGDLPVARWCALIGMVRYGDTVWQGTRVAWLHAQRWDSVFAAQYFRDMFGMTLEPHQRAELAWHLQPRSLMEQRVRWDGRQPSSKELSRRDRYMNDVILASAFKEVDWEEIGLVSPDSLDLVRHFRSITVTWPGEFRACLSGDLAWNCHGRDRWLADTAATVRRYRIWSPVTGEPEALVVMPASDADVTTLVTGWAADGSEPVFSRLARSTNDPAVAVILPRLGNEVGWVAYSHREDGRIRGDQWGESHPADSGAPVAMSDLVIGTRGVDVPWNGAGEEAIPVRISPVVSGNAPVTIFWQIHRSGAIDEVDVRIRVRNRGGRMPVELSMKLPLEGVVTGRVMDLDIGNLGRGEYEIELEVAGAEGSPVRRSVPLIVR